MTGLVDGSGREIPSSNNYKVSHLHEIAGLTAEVPAYQEHGQEILIDAFRETRNAVLPNGTDYKVLKDPEKREEFYIVLRDKLKEMCGATGGEGLEARLTGSDAISRKTGTTLGELKSILEARKNSFNLNLLGQYIPQFQDQQSRSINQNLYEEINQDWGPALVTYLEQQKAEHPTREIDYEYIDPSQLTREQIIALFRRYVLNDELTKSTFKDDKFFKDPEAST
jgi:hypothetical protein